MTSAICVKYEFVLNLCCICSLGQFPWPNYFKYDSIDRVWYIMKSGKLSQLSAVSQKTDIQSFHLIFYKS